MDGVQAKAFTSYKCMKWGKPRRTRSEALTPSTAQNQNQAVAVGYWFRAPENACSSLIGLVIALRADYQFGTNNKQHYPAFSPGAWHRNDIRKFVRVSPFSKGGIVKAGAIASGVIVRFAKEVQWCWACPKTIL